MEGSGQTSFPLGFKGILQGHQLLWLWPFPPDPGSWESSEPLSPHLVLRQSQVALPCLQEGASSWSPGAGQNSLPTGAFLTFGQTFVELV